MVIAPVKSGQAEALLPLVVQRLGIHYPQEPVIRPRGAGCHHIFCIEAGEGMVETEEGCFPLRAGSALFMRSCLPVKYYGDKDFTSAWITFGGEGADRLLDYLNAGEFACMEHDGILPMITDCFYAAESGAGHAELSSRTYSLLVTYFGAYHTSKALPSLLQAKKYAEEHYRESLSVSDLAAAAGISESLLYRLFREGEGSSPTVYLRSVRLRRARQMLLSEPGASVESVAKESGFSDAAYFCKVFREDCGMTPRQYRARFLPT